MKEHSKTIGTPTTRGRDAAQRNNRGWEAPMNEVTRRGRLTRGLESLRRRIAELETQKDSFSAILDQVGVGVAVMDDSGRTVRCNRLWHDYVPTADPSHGFGQPKVWHALEDEGRKAPTGEWPVVRAFRGEQVSGVKVGYRLNDGREASMRVSAVPLRTEHGRVVEAVCTVREADALVHAEEALRRSQELLTDELLAARQLQETSEQTTAQGDFGPLIERILDAAVVIMRSDFASIQVRDNSGELKLLGLRGFAAGPAGFGEVVTLSSPTTCGEALRTGKRAIAADVEDTPYMAGSEDLEQYRKAGIRACQTTPLRTRGGRVVGMLSTHWHEPHHPAAYDLASLDVLARQAADLIEHWQAEEKQRNLARNLEDERRLVLRLSAPILRVKEGLLLLPLIGRIDRERADAIATELLDRVSDERAGVVLIDASATAQIEAWVGDWLLRNVRAVQFLGSKVVLTGVPARLARSLIALSTEADGIIIGGDLQEGLERARVG